MQPVETLTFEVELYGPQLIHLGDHNLQQMIKKTKKKKHGDHLFIQGAYWAFDEAAQLSNIFGRCCCTELKNREAFLICFKLN